MGVAVVVSPTRCGILFRAPHGPSVHVKTWLLNPHERTSRSASAGDFILLFQELRMERRGGERASGRGAVSISLAFGRQRRFGERHLLAWLANHQDFACRGHGARCKLHVLAPITITIDNLRY